MKVHLVLTAWWQLKLLEDVVTGTKRAADKTGDTALSERLAELLEVLQGGAAGRVEILVIEQIPDA